MLQGEIFHYVQSPQLLADALHCQALRHVLLVESEGDVGAAVGVTGPRVAFLGSCRRIRAPALSILKAGLHKAMAVPNRQTALA